MNYFVLSCVAALSILVVTGGCSDRNTNSKYLRSVGVVKAGTNTNAELYKYFTTPDLPTLPIDMRGYAIFNNTKPESRYSAVYLLADNVTQESFEVQFSSLEVWKPVVAGGEVESGRLLIEEFNKKRPSIEPAFKESDILSAGYINWNSNCNALYTLKWTPIIGPRASDS